MRRRSGRCTNAEGLIAPMSVHSKRIFPAVGSIRRDTRRPSVLLPDPLSPTTPRLWPLSMSKLILSSAVTACAFHPRPLKTLRSEETVSTADACRQRSGLGRLVTEAADLHRSRTGAARSALQTGTAGGVPQDREVGRV